MPGLQACMHHHVLFDLLFFSCSLYNVKNNFIKHSNICLNRKEFHNRKPEASQNIRGDCGNNELRMVLEGWAELGKKEGGGKEGRKEGSLQRQPPIYQSLLKTSYTALDCVALSILDYCPTKLVSFMGLAEHAISYIYGIIFMKKQTMWRVLYFACYVGTQESQTNGKKGAATTKQQWLQMTMCLKWVEYDRHHIPCIISLHSCYSLDDVLIPILKLRCSVSES